MRARTLAGRWKDCGLKERLYAASCSSSWPWPPLGTCEARWRYSTQRARGCAAPTFLAIKKKRIAASRGQRAAEMSVRRLNIFDPKHARASRRKGEREWIFARGGCFLLHKTRFVCGASSFILRFQEGLEAIIGSSGDKKDKLYASKVLQWNNIRIVLLRCDINDYWLLGMEFMQCLTLIINTLKNWINWEIPKKVNMTRAITLFSDFFYS